MTLPELVVFDFDGTLAETREAVAATVNAALRAHELPRVTPSVIHALMGMPLAQMFVKLVPIPLRDGVPTASLMRWYRVHFADLGAPRVRLLPGVLPLLDALAAAAVPLAIATSRERSSLIPLMSQLGLRGRFAAIATCDDVAQGKPHPETLLRVLRACDCAPEAAWMVGDTSFDVGMAVAAGVPVIGLTHGSHDRARLAAAGATHIFDDPDPLLRLWGLDPVSAC